MSVPRSISDDALMELLKAGKRDKEIAYDLHVHPGTVSRLIADAMDRCARRLEAMPLRCIWNGTKQTIDPAMKSSPFHGGNRGSNPRGDATIRSPYRAIEGHENASFLRAPRR